MANLVLAGSFTRDQIRYAHAHWTQPGGAPWHAGLALRPGSRARAFAQAGPWARAFALPAIHAMGLTWSGPPTTDDTAFVNTYGPDRRYQRLLSASRPIDEADLRPQEQSTANTGLVISPLFPTAFNPDALRTLVRDAVFVGFDAQGLLRRVGPRGVVETAPIGATAERSTLIQGASVVKFSQREFDAAYPNSDRSARAARLASETNAEILVSFGDQGAMLARPDGPRIDTFDRQAGIEGADTTGAGDVLLARYVEARVDGLPAPEALDAAVDAVAALLRRRALLPAGPRVEVLTALRRLYLVALWAWRRLTRPAASAAAGEQAANLFAREGRLAHALAPHFPRPVLSDDIDMADRGPALAGACWALWTWGWPADEALGAGNLNRISLEEQATASRLRDALLA